MRPRGSSLEAQRRILRALVLRGPLRYEILVQETDLHRSTVSKNLRILDGIGVVNREKVGRAVTYESKVQLLARWCIFLLLKRSIDFRRVNRKLLKLFKSSHGLSNSIEQLLGLRNKLDPGLAIQGRSDDVWSVLYWDETQKYTKRASRYTLPPQRVSLLKGKFNEYASKVQESLGRAGPIILRELWSEKWEQIGNK